MFNAGTQPCSIIKINQWQVTACTTLQVRVVVHTKTKRVNSGVQKNTGKGSKINVERGKYDCKGAWLFTKIS
jgi:hypothetical protein